MHKFKKQFDYGANRFLICFVPYEVALPVPLTTDPAVTFIGQLVVVVDVGAVDAVAGVVGVLTWTLAFGWVLWQKQRPSGPLLQ